MKLLTCRADNFSTLHQPTELSSLLAATPTTHFGYESFQTRNINESKRVSLTPTKESSIKTHLVKVQKRGKKERPHRQRECQFNAQRTLVRDKCITDNLEDFEGRIETESTDHNKII